MWKMQEVGRQKTREVPRCRLQLQEVRPPRSLGVDMQSNLSEKEGCKCEAEEEVRKHMSEEEGERWILLASSHAAGSGELRREKERDDESG